MHILVKKNYLSYGDYKVKCAVGKRGIKRKRKEGDLITPKGLFSIKSVFYRKDRIKNLKSKFKITPISKKMGWCNDSKSSKYNKLIKYPFKYGSEKLYRPDRVYDIILVLNYNMSPVIKNKGSAIFIHITNKKFKPTEGCVAIQRKHLRNILKRINRKTKVKIN